MAGELITADYQVQLGTGRGAILFVGDRSQDTGFTWGDLTGWNELPGFDSTDVLRPVTPGGWAGAMFAQTRTITLTGWVLEDGPGFSANVAALRAATQVNPLDSTIEMPLAAQLPGEQPLVAYVRCTKRTPIVGQSYASNAGEFTLQFVATDPRRYGLTAQSASAGLPQPPTGLSFPLVFPLNFGSVGTSGTIAVTNHGDTPTPPTMTITGPVTTPQITRQDTGATLTFNVTLSSADVLTVDPLNGQATLNGGNATGLLAPTSSPISSFLLAPGVVPLAFRAASVPSGELLTVTWSDAYL